MTFLVSQITPLLPVTFSIEKGASSCSWFPVFSSDRFVLHKGAFLTFCASIAVGYLWVFYPNVFVAMDLLLIMLHYMNSGFPTVRYSKLRDLTIQLFFPRCYQPVLQKLSGENPDNHVGG